VTHRLAIGKTPQVLAFPGSWTVLWTSSGLLGLQQGMVWSVTILLFMDLLGPRHRGLASGANETLGYAASALFSKVRHRPTDGSRASLPCVC